MVSEAARCHRPSARLRAAPHGQDHALTDANRSNGLSYRDAGVDIDRGNRLVERIKPLAAATGRPEVLGGLGGFGGLMRVPLERYREPVLVSGTDGQMVHLVHFMSWNEIRRGNTGLLCVIT